MKRLRFLLAAVVTVVVSVPVVAQDGAAPVAAPAAAPSTGDASGSTAEDGAAGDDEILAEEERGRRLPASLSAIETTFAERIPPDSPIVRQFGYDFFDRARPIAANVDDAYELGPDDSVLIYLWGEIVTAQGERRTLDGVLGGQSTEGASTISRYEATVGRDGYIFYPPIGRLFVSGTTIAAFEQLLQERMARSYRGFNLDVTIGEVRTFPVTVTGFVDEPGVVYVTNLTTVAEALAAAGGVNRQGSLRSIIVRRGVGGTDEITIDLYDVLIDGGAFDVTVRPGDTILVPPIGEVVAVTGAVKRGAIYELGDEASITDVVGLAGGLLPGAAPNRVRVTRETAERLRIEQGALGDAAFVTQMGLAGGDIIVVPGTTPVVENRAVIRGAVLFPGDYALEAVPTLRALLERAELTASTNQFYGELTRVRQEDGRVTFQVFVPGAILDGTTDIDLQPNDSIRLIDYGDTQTPDFDVFPDVVVIRGNVRYPGVYALVGETTLADLITDEQLLVNTDLDYATIERRSDAGREMVTFSPRAVVAGESDVVLQRSDTISFLPRELREPVRVGGAVTEPSVFPSRDDLTLLTVLRSVELTGAPDRLKAQIFRRDPATGLETVVQTIYLLDLLVEGESSLDIVLDPGDHVVIEPTEATERDRTVRILGEVRGPGLYEFYRGMTLADLLIEAGGYTEFAYPRAMVVTRESARRVQVASLRRAASSLESAATRLPSGVIGTATAEGATSGEAGAAFVVARARAIRDVLEQNQEGFGRLVLDLPRDLDGLADALAAIQLEAGDQVFIPREPRFVAVVGDVYNQAVLPYQGSARVRDYLDIVGGSQRSARASDIYIIKFSGRVVNQASLGSRLVRPISAQRLEPGDTIVVPPSLNFVSGWQIFQDVLTTVTDILLTGLSTYNLLTSFQ